MGRWVTGNATHRHQCYSSVDSAQDVQGEVRAEVGTAHSSFLTPAPGPQAHMPQTRKKAEAAFTSSITQT